MVKHRRGLELPLEACAIDMRDAFFDELNKVATDDPNVLLLTDDQGAFSLEWMRENLPHQYINVGIAEQNLISVAAGLALGGKVPFVYGIATFMTMRCYEQIRDDLCCMNLPVTILASGAGYMYGGDGPTHHATEELAILRALPGMTILNPSDAASTAQFVHIAHQGAGPKYIRIEKGTLGRIYDDGHDFSAGFEVLLEGSDLVILSTGVMVHQALDVAKDLSSHGLHAGVIDVYRIKPINADALLASIGDASRIVTLEEHSVVGGLGSLVSEILADRGRPMPLQRFGTPDRFNYNYGGREWQWRLVGLDRESVTRGILAKSLR